MISVDMFRSCKHLVLVVVVVVALIVGVIAVPYLFFPYALPLASAGVGGFMDFFMNQTNQINHILWYIGRTLHEHLNEMNLLIHLISLFL